MKPGYVATDIRFALDNAKRLPYTREAIHVITKLEEALHWLRDIPEPAPYGDTGSTQETRRQPGFDDESGKLQAAAPSPVDGKS